MLCLIGGDVLGGCGLFLVFFLTGWVYFGTVVCVGCSGVGVFVGVFVVCVLGSVGGCHCLWKQCAHVVSSAMMGALLKHVCE